MEKSLASFINELYKQSGATYRGIRKTMHLGQATVQGCLFGKDKSVFTYMRVMAGILHDSNPNRHDQLRHYLHRRVDELMDQVEEDCGRLPHKKC